ncbi:DUF2790 domain-containing protein [Pseudomonas fluorescens]|nr:DUF2790 domain-containing protein [Pseudomonas fluorescens]
MSSVAAAQDLTARAPSESIVIDGETLPLKRPDSWFVKDIDRIISISPVSERCEVAPVRMVYMDSEQKKYVLEYRVMGNGCN